MLKPALEMHVARSGTASDPEDAPESTPLLAFLGRALGSRLKLFVKPPSGAAAGAAQLAAEVRPAAEAAWSAVVAEFAAVDAALSRFRADSELTGLNQLAGTGTVALVSWRLRTMLAAAHRATCLTNGRFDASIVDVMERIGEYGASMSGAALVPFARAGGIAGDRDQSIALVPSDTPRASRVRVPQVPIDSGGIGKGLALRWGAAAAMACLPNGSGVLLDAGGDVVAAGTPPPEDWLIGIEDPFSPQDEPAEPIAVYALRAGGVSTSSVAVRNWTAPDGRAVHHLIDPMTREPARSGLVSVTVAGPDPAWNEVWSKALFLGGSESIGEEARRRGLAAWWVDERGRLGMTPEARVRSAWIDEARVG